MSTISTIATDCQSCSTSVISTVAYRPIADLINVCRNEGRNICNFFKFIGGRRKRSLTESSEDTRPAPKRVKLTTVCMAGGGDFPGRGRPGITDDYRSNKERQIRNWIEKEKQNEGRYEHNPRPVYNPNCIFCNQDWFIMPDIEVQSCWF